MHLLCDVPQHQRRKCRRPMRAFYVLAVLHQVRKRFQGRAQLSMPSMQQRHGPVLAFVLSVPWARNSPRMRGICAPFAQLAFSLIWTGLSALSVPPIRTILAKVINYVSPARLVKLRQKEAPRQILARSNVYRERGSQLTVAQHVPDKHSNQRWETVLVRTAQIIRKAAQTGKRVCVLRATLGMIIMESRMSVSHASKGHTKL